MGFRPARERIGEFRLPFEIKTALCLGCVTLPIVLSVPDRGRVQGLDLPFGLQVEQRVCVAV